MLHRPEHGTSESGVPTKHSHDAGGNHSHEGHAQHTAEIKAGAHKAAIDDVHKIYQRKVSERQNKFPAFTPLYAKESNQDQVGVIDFSRTELQLKGIDHKGAPKFDSHKSVSEHIKSGTFAKETDRPALSVSKPLEVGKAPTIAVVYEEKGSKNQDSEKPNYIVKKDGTVSVVENPEGPPHAGRVVIQVERDAKQVGAPNVAQQKSIDALVDYQGDRIKQSFGHALKEVPTGYGTGKQVEIEDPQNLVSDNVEQKFGNKLPPDVSKLAATEISADVKQTSDSINRVQGSGGGHITIPRESAPGRRAGDSTPAGVDQMIPPRSVPQAPRESDQIAAAKDAAASLFNPERSHPYQTIKENSDGYRVGRYGLNQGFTMIGLAELMGVDLGNPPDFSKLQKFLKEHPGALSKAIERYADKLNQDADKAHLSGDDLVRQSAKTLTTFSKSLQNPEFCAQWTQFLSDMKRGGQPITQDRLDKFMPKELQELIAEKGITHQAKLLGENPDKLSDQGAGKIALSMLLGRTPNEADVKNSQYADYARTASNMFKLAESRMQNLGDIEVTDAQGKIMASASRSVGQAMWQKYMNGGRLGCAASVSAVLNNAGFSYANSIGVSALHDQLVAHGWKVSSTPHPGDVVCGYRRPKGSGPGGSAHVGIVGTDGTWDNHSRSQVWSRDPLSAWNRREYPAGVVFLRPPGA